MQRQDGSNYAILIIKVLHDPSIYNVRTKQEGEAKDPHWIKMDSVTKHKVSTKTTL